MRELCAIITVLFASSAFAEPDRKQLFRKMMRTIDRNWSAMTTHVFDRPGVVYVPKSELKSARRQLLRAKVLGRGKGVELKKLPHKRQWPRNRFPPGALYLRNKFVSPAIPTKKKGKDEPGFSFERSQFGWDSYFIVMGVLHSRKYRLAKGMVDNALSQVKELGMVPNANHSFFLNRSQPPVLSQMMRLVYEHSSNKKKADRWLRDNIAHLERYFEYWRTDKRLTNTGLSRYWSDAKGPAPEVKDSDDMKNYGRWMEGQGVKHPSMLRWLWQQDLAGRVSGFDFTELFGKLGIGVLEHNPVSLNCFLHRMARDIAHFHHLLGNEQKSTDYQRKAATIANLVNSPNLLWDAKRKLYLPYNTRTGKRRYYPFLTTFMPLWTGIASREQARQLVEHLGRFECSGGLMTSPNTKSAGQWDGKITWAPLVWLTVKGLRNYDYHTEANRVATKFLRNVLDEFGRSGKLREKYHADGKTAEIANLIRHGYKSNEEGFGWTNGVVLDLWGSLPAKWKEKVLAD